ncbi:MAG TPA: HepT-like ribonuclease domain-containing protein [Thermoanaerobaculia bacterium]|jgi:uncharacterized protein with HEPN domain
MPPPDDSVRARLEDIEDCCSAIVGYVGGLTFAEFAADRRTRAAVERELITIGEAVGHVLRARRDLEQMIPDARSIVDLRNVLVHGYRRLDQTTIWALALTEVPELLTRVRHLLRRLDPETRNPA